MSQPTVHSVQHGHLPFAVPVAAVDDLRAAAQGWRTARAAGSRGRGEAWAPLRTAIEALVAVAYDSSEFSPRARIAMGRTHVLLLKEKLAEMDRVQRVADEASGQLADLTAAPHHKGRRWAHKGLGHRGLLLIRRAKASASSAPTPAALRLVVDRSRRQADDLTREVWGHVEGALNTAVDIPAEKSLATTWQAATALKREAARPPAPERPETTRPPTRGFSTGSLAGF